MRWYKKRTQKRVRHIVTKFLWFPKTLWKGDLRQTRWLETASWWRNPFTIIGSRYFDTY